MKKAHTLENALEFRTPCIIHMGLNLGGFTLIYF